MELRHLRYFVAVAESLNFSKAAVKLRVAQPALSRQIRDLEDELGVTLLERGSRGVRLTAAGRRFADEARAVLQRARQAMDATRAVAQDDHGEIHVGYAPSPTVEILPRALHAFQNEAPNAKISLHDFSSEEMLRGIRERGLDVALMARPCTRAMRGLVFEELVRFLIQVALSSRHPFARRSTLALKQTAGERLHVFSRSDYPEYHDWLERLLNASGESLTVAAEHDSATSLIAAVESGRGMAVVPSCVACLAGTRLRFVEVRPAPEPVVVGVAYLPAKLSPVAARFVKLLRTLRQNPSGASSGVRTASRQDG